MHVIDGVGFLASRVYWFRCSSAGVSLMVSACVCVCASVTGLTLASLTMHVSNDDVSVSAFVTCLCFPILF